MEMGVELEKGRNLMADNHNQCLICSSNRLKDLREYEEHHLVKCLDCGFVFSRKIPTPEELKKHYQGYTRGEAISPITVKRYNELLDTFEAYRKENKLLDIGCGDGHFLEVAKERGWEVYGTEFTDEAIEVCRNKNFFISKGILDLENYKEISFDVITSFEVIEHINNPLDELKNIHSLLRKGGIFYFTTPNFNSLSRRIVGNKWNVIEYPEHLSYYTHGTIHTLMTRTHFRRIDLRTSGISFARIRNSKGLNPQNDRTSDEQLREKIEKKRGWYWVKTLANFLLNTFRWGDSLKGTYQKF